MYYYSKSTGGFYTIEIHGASIPADAVEITTDEHTALHRGLADGKRIVADAGGWPTLIEPPSPTTAELVAAVWERIKAERDRRKAGGVLVDGYWIHSDADSRIQWLGIKDSARDLFAAGKDGGEPVIVLGQPLRWKTLSGEFAPVTAQMGFDVVEATKELDAILFATAEAKRAAMMAAADPAAYDVLDGWPTTYGK